MMLTGSEGLGIRPSKGEVPTPVANKSAIFVLALARGVALTPASDAILEGTLGTSIGYMRPAWNPSNKGLKNS